MAWWERLYPVLCALAASAIYLVAGAPLPPAASYPSLMEAVGAVAAILVGFLGASKAILLTISGTETLRLLRRSGYYDILQDYIRSAINVSITFVIYSMVMLFVEPTSTFGISFKDWTIVNLHMAVWVFFGTYSAASFWRVSSVIFKLLKLSAKDPDPAPKAAVPASPPPPVDPPKA